MGTYCSVIKSEDEWQCSDIIRGKGKVYRPEECRGVKGGKLERDC